MKSKSNVLASGIVNKQPARCRLYSPDIHWLPRYGRGARTDSSSHKNPYSAPPTGELVRRIFGRQEDWNDEGLIPLAWAEGRLNPVIEDAIYRKPPDFWKITGPVCCNGCEGEESCKFWGNPLEDRVEKFLEYFVNYSREYPIVWEALDKHLQRGIILLSLLGITGQRPDGYHGKDLRGIIGVQGRTLTRIKKELDLMGILHLRRGRYCFAGRQTNGEKLYVAKKLKCATDLFYARYLKSLTGSVKVEVDIRRASTFKQKEKYDFLPIGISVGRQPPQWFLELLSEFLDLFKHTWTYHFNPRIDCVEDKSWRTSKRFSKNRERLNLVNRSESRENLIREYSKSLGRILELDDRFTEDNAREWLEFCKSMRFEITGNSYKISRRSVFLLDLAEIDMRRTRTLQGGRVVLATAPRERQEKRTWSLGPPLDLSELRETDIRQYLNW